MTTSAGAAAVPHRANERLFRAISDSQIPSSDRTLFTLRDGLIAQIDSYLVPLSGDGRVVGDEVHLLHDADPAGTTSTKRPSTMSVFRRRLAEAA